MSRGILTYSLSPNPDSPHFADQTMLFSQKQWVNLPFHIWEVYAQAESITSLKEGSKDCKGGGWKEYQANGEVCGVALPEGLQQASQLPEPIFTPATKAESGQLGQARQGKADDSVRG